MPNASLHTRLSLDVQLEFFFLKTPLEYQDKNFSKAIFRNKTDIERKRIFNEYKLRRERLTGMVAMKYIVFCTKVFSPIEIG